MPSTGLEIRLAAHPRGRLRRDDFALVEAPVADPGEGEILVETLWVSVDPMLRIFIDESPLGGAMAPLPVGAVIPGAAVGRVVASRRQGFAAGDLVTGRLGWRDFAVCDGAGLQKLEPEIASFSRALGVLGLPGFSAYVGLHVTGPIAAGQTVLVSGAAGAVGSVAGPLAKQAGARVVGIASGPARCQALVAQLGYDTAVDRSAPDFAAALSRALPQGADIFFDNVGGDIFFQALPMLSRAGRVTICGLMAQYERQPAEGADRLPAALELVMSRSLTIRSFSNTAYAQLRPEFLARVAPMVEAGEIPAPEHVTVGLENTPEAFVRLFESPVVGKSVVKTARA